MGVVNGCGYRRVTLSSSASLPGISGTRLTTGATPAVTGKYYKGEDEPCPGHVVEALNYLGIADKWWEIGEVLVSNKFLKESKLRNIRGENNAAIKLMISKCENLKWYIITGVVCIVGGEEKAEEIRTFRENKP